MPQRHDWTTAIDAMLIEATREASCLLCDHRPVVFMDIVEIGQCGVSYAVCARCRRKDPRADQVTALLIVRRMPHHRKEGR